MSAHLDQASNTAAHTVAVTATVIAWTDWVPAVFAIGASILAACWWLLCIYESKTFQAWRAKRRSRAK
jgi:hypothetical protein